MKTDCGVIRDLLPLYADDVCSEASRQMVEEHLSGCPACTEILGRLRENEIESGLKEERNEVISWQAKKFRTRSATVGSVIACIFAVPILVCLIVNLASGAALGWFFVVLAAMAVAASLVIVPLTVAEDKLFWTFCAFCASLMLLLGVCCFYSHGTWFLTAASATLFGLSAVFLPFVIRAKPVKKLLGNCNRALLVISVDTVLFANMMNVVTGRSKSFVATALLELLCVAGLVLIAEIVKTKRGE
jgi:hypothetical protein